MFKLQINGIKLPILSWVWLLLLNVMFIKIILLFIVAILSFLLINTTLCEDTIIFIHSIIDGHLNYFLFVLLQMHILISIV